MVLYTIAAKESSDIYTEKLFIFCDVNRCDPSTVKKRVGMEWHIDGLRAGARRGAQVTAELDEGTYIEPSKTPLSEWLETWLETYVRFSVKPHTFDSYTRVCEKHLAQFSTAASSPS
jgi:hypothetical protein